MNKKLYNLLKKWTETGKAANLLDGNRHVGNKNKAFFLQRNRFSV